MHEVSLVEALFDAVDAAWRGVPGAAGPGAVRLVCVRVGAASGVEPALFETAYAVGRAARGFAQAELRLVIEAERWRCAACQAELPDPSEGACPACGDLPRLVAGGGIHLDRVELDVADTAPLRGPEDDDV